MEFAYSLIRGNEQLSVPVGVELVGLIADIRHRQPDDFMYGYLLIDAGVSILG
jgi:hypothetical protein